MTNRAQELPWFRLYHEIVDDDKIRLLAFEDRWHFIAILCCKAKGLLDDEEQSFDMMQRRLAVRLGLQVRETEELQRRLMEVGLVDSYWQPRNWSKRQRRSDHDSTAAERKRRQRDRNGSHGGVTEESRVTYRDSHGDVTRLEVEGEGEREEEKSRGGTRKRASQATPIPEDFEPDDKLLQWAQANTPAIDPRAEVGKFVDYHRAKGNTFKDHRAAFRTWLRKAQEFREQRQPAKGEEAVWDIAD